MSDFVRPHRRQPTRLPRPWDSPSKNTGVGCHFLLQCMKVKSESEVTQSCLTPSDPMDCSPPGPSIHGIFQARVLEWGAIAFSTHAHYHMENRQPGGICRVTQWAQAWYSVTTSKGGMGWEVGGRFTTEGTYVYLWLSHADIWQKLTQYCKAVVLQ